MIIVRLSSCGEVGFVLEGQSRSSIFFLEKCYLTMLKILRRRDSVCTDKELHLELHEN